MTFNLWHFLGAIILALIIGGSLTSCEPEVIPAAENTLPPAENFTVAYNPCADPLLQYERGSEGEVRKKQCGVK